MIASVSANQLRAELTVSPGRHRTPQARDAATLAGGQPHGLPLAALAVSTTIDLVLIPLLAWRVARPPSLATLVALHLAGTLAPLLSARTAGSAKLLTWVLTTTIPLAGLALAALAICTRSRADLIELGPDQPERTLTDPARVRHLVEAPGACEVLLDMASDERRAVLTVLTRRGDAQAVAVLRWLTASGGEAGVEAALALEEMRSRFETTLALRREAMAQAPSTASALRLVMVVTHALEAGLPDHALADLLLAEARSCWTAARHLAWAECSGTGDGPAVLAAVRARLELAVLRPDLALGILDEALGAPPLELSDRQALLALRREAGLRAHLDDRPLRHEEAARAAS